ncbi:hypothetical protein AX14_014293 [Amanita brunnescens Koide BX004]|nr:hypothetical protein AX14_014293 [Amanita brunnescens Koide BX004]
MAEVHVPVFGDTAVQINIVAIVNAVRGVNFVATVNFAVLVAVGGVYGAIGAVARDEDVEMAEAVEDVELGEVDKNNQRIGVEELREEDVEMAEAGEDIEMGEAGEGDERVGVEEDMEIGAMADCRRGRHEGK